MKPLISIITTLYNYKRYLQELVDSVLAQTYINWEWCIVDDASTDDPLEVLLPYAENRKIRYRCLDRNSGYSVAKNVGLKMAQGDYFVMIDADDALLPRSLEIRYNELSQHPDKLWIHADALNYNLLGDIERTYIGWNQKKRKQLIQEGVDLTKTYHHRLIHAQTVMVRREFHEVLGLYDEQLRFSSDNEMWRRAIRFGHVPLYVPESVCIYRAHEDRMSRSEYKKRNVPHVKEYIKKIVEERFHKGVDGSGVERLEKRL